MSKYSVFILWTFLAACSSSMVKPSSSPKKTSANISSAGSQADIDDALLGTWDETSVSCSKGEMTEEGKQASAAFRSGMSVAKAVVTSDRTYWDMKDYKDVESPNDFCQVSVEEKWTTPNPGNLVVSDSDTVVTGSGQVVCDKKYTYKDVRKHTYKASEKELTITLNSAHEALTGVSTTSKPICKDGFVVLSFQRDSGDE